MERKIKYICNAARWFDKVNGNTYHSVRIIRVKDNKVIVSPLQYGYGNHYEQTALELMAANKWLPVKYRGHTDSGSPLAYMYARENNYPIHWVVSDGLKRDCVANGII